MSEQSQHCALHEDSSTNGKNGSETKLQGETRKQGAGLPLLRSKKIIAKHSMLHSMTQIHCIAQRPSFKEDPEGRGRTAPMVVRRYHSYAPTP